MTANITRDAHRFTNELVSEILNKSNANSSYHNYIQHLSSDKPKLNKLVRHHPASILFNNPKLIRDIASEIASDLQDASNLDKFEKEPLYFNINCPDPKRAVDKKWWQRQLNKECRRDFEMLRLHFGKVSFYKDNYASELQVTNYILRQKSTEKWMKKVMVTDKLSLAQCARSNYARFSELYAILKGLNTYAVSLDYCWTFVTVTAPPEFHSSPKFGASKWDGSSPRDSNNVLKQKWHKTQSNLYKKGIHHFGLRVIEPNSDATPHYHFMIWHKKGDFNAIEKAFKLQFPLKNQVTFLQNNGTSSASSYICKYIRKSTNLDEDDELTKVCAWRSIWGLRAFQFFGVNNQITKWRELRRIKKDSSAIWKAANTGDFATYLYLLKNNNTSFAPSATSPIILAKPIMWILVSLFSNLSRSCNSNCSAKSKVLNFSPVTGSRSNN